METIGELAEFLGCFDPSLPVKALVVTGAPGSEVVSISAMGIVNPVVVRSGGAVSSVWLVARTGPAEAHLTPPMVFALLRSDCDCVIEVPVALDRPVVTWGIECEHSAVMPS